MSKISLRNESASAKYRTAATPWTHASDDWVSPVALFAFLNNLYQFDVDVCASASNAKCRRLFTTSHNGLKQDWKSGQSHWMNPPYSEAGL
jgi:phage N-6-adenine-methyltransferase